MCSWAPDCRPAAACASCPAPCLGAGGACCRLPRTHPRPWEGSRPGCTACRRRRSLPASRPPRAVRPSRAEASTRTRWWWWWCRRGAGHSSSSASGWGPSSAMPGGRAGRGRGRRSAGRGRRRGARRQARARRSRRTWTWAWGAPVSPREEPVADVLGEEKSRAPVLLDRPVAHVLRRGGGAGGEGRGEEGAAGGVAVPVGMRGRSDCLAGGEARRGERRPVRGRCDVEKMVALEPRVWQVRSCRTCLPLARGPPCSHPCRRQTSGSAAARVMRTAAAHHELTFDVQQAPWWHMLLASVTTPPDSTPFSPPPA